MIKQLNINDFKEALGSSGTTAQRPTGLPAGSIYFDTDLALSITYDGTNWIKPLETADLSSFATSAYVDTQITAANGYTDTVGDSLSQAAAVYVDGEITTLTSYVDNEITTLSGTLTTYVDGLDSSELQKIDEGNGFGWRLLGADVANHGNIGLHAIDLSTQEFAGDYGAMGENSLVHGWGSSVSGASSFAGGWENIVLGSASLSSGYGNTISGDYSIAAGDSNFVGQAGIVVGEFSKAIGATKVLEVLTVVGQEVTVVSGGLSHLGRVTITSPEADPRDMSDIYSFKVTAKAGDHFTVEGDTSNILPGMKVYDVYGSSYVFGSDAVATGNISSAFGIGTLTINEAQTVLGKYNVGTSIDTILEVGVGAYGAHVNGLEVYTDGTITAPEATEALINARGTRALATKEYVDNATPVIADPTEHDYTATASQTDFIISNTVLTYVGVFVDGIKKKSDKYTIANDGTHTTVSFIVGQEIALGAWVQLVQYN